MNKAENKRSIIVGVFIFLGALIFIAAVLTLGSKQKTFVQKTEIKAVFDDISGLKVGNNIWFSGVKIGTIKAINLLGENNVEVVMGIETQVKKFIRKDAVAKLGSEGLIGNKIVVISGGSSKSPEIVNGDKLRVERVISTDDIMNTLQQNNKNLVGITSDFKSISSKIARGEGTLGALLSNDTMAVNIKSMIANLQTASANTNKISAALNQFSTKLNDKQGLANKLLTDTVVFSNLNASVEKLQQTAATASQVASSLDKASNKLNADDNAIGTLLNNDQVSTDLKNTIKNLESSTKKLDENMEALKHNFLFRGYFRKQEKEAAKQKQ